MLSLGIMLNTAAHHGRHMAIAIVLAMVVVAPSACMPGRLVSSSHATGSFTGRVVSGHAADSDVQVDCTWLEDETGRRLAVIYPDGWDEAFRPTRILDASGAVFAREGDLVRVTFIDDGIGETVCSPGKPVAAETIELVAGAQQPVSPTTRP